MTYQSLEYTIGLVSPKAILEGEQLLLCNRYGDIIWSNHPIKKDSNYAKMVTGVAQVQWDNEPMLQTVSPPTALGWRIISYLPLNDISVFTESLRNTNLLVLLALIILSFVLSAIMAFIVTKPLTQLTKSFKQVGMGNFDAKITISGSDELSVIGDAYNEMLSNTKKIIREKYELKMLITRAELEALQSQINPHFLFNTLNSIKTVINGNSNAKAAQMVQVLADLLRYNLSHGQYSVTFAEDLDITRKYLYLQQCRFGEHYQVDYEIDDAVLPLPILKLTLQPLVENAIQHGLEHASSHGSLHIVAKRLGEQYVVYIANTGKIIDEEKLREINKRLIASLTDSPLSQDQLGIFNVNRRIRLHYGDKYGLKLSRSTEYTTVRIFLPAQADEVQLKN